MSKKVIAAFMALVLIGPLVGGCAQLQALSNAANLSTASVANPITMDKLFEIEASLKIAISALQTYKKACAANAADKVCRANVAAIQVYTRQFKPYFLQLRAFVRNNDQINAANTYQALVNIYNQAQATAVNLGVSIGS